MNNENKALIINSSAMKRRKKSCLQASILSCLTVGDAKFLRLYWLFGG